MICSKCGNEIAVGQVCGKCGTVNSPDGKPAMRVTAYGAVVPEDSGVYVASSLGMAMLAEDTGASQAGELKEREALKDEGNAFAEETKPQASAYAANTVESASTYAANPVEPVNHTHAADPVEVSKNEPVTSASNLVKKAYTVDISETVSGTVETNKVSDTVKVSENSGTYAAQEETDTQKILERAKAKSAKTFAQSSFAGGHSDFDLNLEEPVAYVPVSSKAKVKKKSSNIMGKIVPLVVVLIIALVATPFVIKYVLQINCDKQIEDIVTLVNERNTNIDSMVDAVFPYFLADAYHEMQLVCEGNLQYQGTMATDEAEITSALTELYDMVYLIMESSLGDMEGFSYKIKDRKELSKDERESVERAYNSMAVLTSGVQALYESMDAISVLDQKELDMLSDIIEGVGKKMENMDISAGYVLTIELKAKGEDKSDKESFEVVVVRADKKWMIEYVSSILINQENSEYEIGQVDQFVDYELNVSKLNEQLKRMSEYVAEDDMMSLYNQILNMY